MQLKNHILLILLPPTSPRNGDSADSNTKFSSALSAHLDRPNCDGHNPLNSPHTSPFITCEEFPKKKSPITMSQLARSNFFLSESSGVISSSRFYTTDSSQFSNQ